MQETVGVGVIGMGFMGWRHAEAFASATRDRAPCRVVALCDARPERLRGPEERGNIRSDEALIDAAFDEARRFQRVEEMLQDARVQLVSVCTPTDSHVEIAIQALRAGKHVLVEKPVALTADGVRPLMEEARQSSTLCMPAHCMRFWPGWEWLRDAVTDGRHGAVRRASFLRSGARPGWSPFYLDDARSGGALIDFHIHDADLALWLFGRPRRTRCAGSLSHVRAEYDFGAGGPRVEAEAEWSNAPDAPFRMEHTVEFEGATVEYRLGRAPAATITDASGTRAIDIGPGTGYDGQARHIVGAIAEGGRGLRVTMDDALAAAELLDAERRSLGTGDWVSL